MLDVTKLGRAALSSLVLASLPFNDSDWQRSDEDARQKYGLLPKRNTNFAWVQHSIHKSAHHGN